MRSRIRDYLQQLAAPIPTAPLAAFRIAFGALMLFSVVRFWALGWIERQYITPEFAFPFVPWAQSLGDPGMYYLFAAMGVAALLILLGLFYRVAIVAFFLMFTYVELIDKTWYLNHYYFVSLVSFLLIWLPAHRQYSLDVLIWPRLLRREVPRWTITTLQAQLAIVYFFAGVAKVQPDWLLEALPLRIWLPAHTHLPLVGGLMDELWVAYVFSWFGCVYDLTIPFWLSWRKSRPWAYIAVVVFHVVTWVLFPIGIFPWVMIVATLIFFSPDWHLRNLEWVREKLNVRKIKQELERVYRPAPMLRQILIVGGILYFSLQLLLPMRYLVFPSDLFWKEEGYRFSWRVMLYEKAGTGFFYVTDPETGRRWVADHTRLLTRPQQKQMSFQPDMILQMAHHIRDEWRKKGIENPVVTAEFYVRMQEQPSRIFTVDSVNLSSKNDTFGRDFIVGYN
ncbi:MAG: HTTM domain-containing protein [Bacteroidota bacterium]